MADRPAADAGANGGADTGTDTTAGRVARIVLLGLGVALGVVGALIYARYRLTAEPVDGAFAAAAGLGALGALVAAWLRPAWRANVALLGTTLVGMVFLLEVLLALGVIFNVKSVKRALHEGAADARQVRIEHLRARGQTVYPPVSPGAVMSEPTFRRRTELLPLGNVANAHVLHCRDRGRTWHGFTSDERGFRNPRGLLTGDSVDVVVIGDSFTYGTCVATDSNYVSRVRERWPRTVNLGAPGNGPLAMLAGLREYVEPLRPPVVVWGYFEGNDLSNLDEEADDPVLGRYVDPAYRQGLRERQAEIDAAIAGWIEERQRIEDTRPSFKVRVLSLYHIRKLLTYQARLGSTGDEQLALFAEVLGQARDEVRGWGGELVFLYLPEWSRYHDTPSTPGMDYRDAVLAVVDSLGLPLVDGAAIMNDHPDPGSLFPGQTDRSHYNTAGYGLVGRALAEALKNRVE